MNRYVIDAKDLVTFLTQYRKRTNPTAQEAADHFLRTHGHHVSKIEAVPAKPHSHVWVVRCFISGDVQCVECGAIR